MEVETLTLEQIDAKIAEFNAALDDAAITPGGSVGATSVTIDTAYEQRIRNRLDDYQRRRARLLNGGLAMPTQRCC